MIVRVVLPILTDRAQRTQRVALAKWLGEVLEPRLAGVQVSQRPEGIVVVAGYQPGAGIHAGALDAGAAVLELISQALERALFRERLHRREHFANLDRATVTIRPARPGEAHR